MYDLIIVGAGPSGLMAARTAISDGLKVLLVEQRKTINPVKSFCSQMIRLGDQGFSSAKKPTDITVNPVTVSFEVTEKSHRIHLKTLREDVTVDYNGPLRTYHNQIWISPSGNFFSTLELNETFYGGVSVKGSFPRRGCSMTVKVIHCSSGWETISSVVFPMTCYLTILT